MLEESEFIVKYNNLRNKRISFIVLMIAIILFIGILSITLGPLKLTFKEVCTIISSRIIPGMKFDNSGFAEKVIWNVRLPRLILCLLAGANLAISGSVMQPVLRNPIASPFTLGISSGASFGAAIAMVFGKAFISGPYFVILNAFLFSIFTSITVLVISEIKGSTPEVMILIGVALSQLFGAGITLMKYFADSDTLSEVVFWMVGSLSKATWRNIGFVFLASIICIPILIIKSNNLNLLDAGDDVAKSLGENVAHVRIFLLIITSLLTSVTICFTGTIGFIGLLAPHITRTIVGNDNKYVVITSGLIGACILVLADLVAVNIIKPIILPIGVVTALIGAPMFIYLIIKRRKAVC